MKERIKEVRKERGLTQSEYANDLGVSFSNIQSYELGRRIPSDAFIRLVCTKYNINETWLLTGEGDMKAPASRESEIAEITALLYNEPEDSFRSKLIKLAAKMTEEQLDILIQLVSELKD